MLVVMVMIRGNDGGNNGGFSGGEGMVAMAVGY